MVIEITLSNGSKLFEEIRTASVGKETLTFYRKSYYTGEKHEILLVDIKSAQIHLENGSIEIY